MSSGVPESDEGGERRGVYMRCDIGLISSIGRHGITKYRDTESVYNQENRPYSGGGSEVTGSIEVP